MFLSECLCCQGFVCENLPPNLLCDNWNKEGIGIYYGNHDNVDRDNTGINIQWYQISYTFIELVIHFSHIHYRHIYYTSLNTFSVYYHCIIIIHTHMWAIHRYLSSVHTNIYIHIYVYIYMQAHVRIQKMHQTRLKTLLPFTVDYLWFNITSTWLLINLLLNNIPALFPVPMKDIKESYQA